MRVTTSEIEYNKLTISCRSWSPSGASTANGLSLKKRDAHLKGVLQPAQDGLNAEGRTEDTATWEALRSEVRARVDHILIRVSAEVILLMDFG